MATTHPKFVRWAVMLGIIIVLNVFFVAARALVLPEPLYDDYCPTRVQPASTEEACIGQSGIWMPNGSGFTPLDKTQNTNGYCDLYQKCQPLYDDARENYELYAFVIMLGLGVLSLIAGVIPMGSSIVSSGLSYGGVLALIIAAGGYWPSAGNLLKLAISFTALASLIYLGARRFKD